MLIARGGRNCAAFLFFSCDPHNFRRECCEPKRTRTVSVLPCFAKAQSEDASRAICDHSCPRQIPRNYKNGNALIWSQPLIFPPRHERLGVREHTRPACRFDQLSSARASVVHRRNELGFLPARAIIASTSEGLHARRVCSVTLSRHQLGVRRHLIRRQNLIFKNHSGALPRRFNGRSPVQLTTISDSSEVPLPFSVR